MDVFHWLLSPINVRSTLLSVFEKPFEGSGPLPVVPTKREGVIVGSELPLRLLVVDKDEAARAVTTGTLESLGHRVAKEDANAH